MNTKPKAMQSTQSIEQSQTPTKALFLNSALAADLTPAERQTLKQTSTERSLQSLQELDVSSLTVAQCFEGTNVKTALKVNEGATRAALAGMISRCVDFIDANKTLSEPAHIALTVSELVQQFPAFTLEDWRLCLYMMAKESFGPYYERLKLAQFVDCFTKYDQLKQPVIQTIRENERKDAERMQAEAMRHLRPEYATEVNPIASRVHAADWMAGENRLTYTERQEMENRQKQSHD